MIAFSTTPLWSPQQQAWLQAMGYSVYLAGGARDVPPSAVVAPVPRSAPVTATGGDASLSPPAAAESSRRRMAGNAPAAPVAAALPAAPGRRAGGFRMPDRLQIALLRASGLDPNAAETRALMDSWPLAELRANPAAKRALWPQLRALRKRRK